MLRTMLRISSRAFHPAIGTIALFLLTSAVAFSQATQSQSPSSRAASGQASSQSSSAQTWPSQSPPNQLPSGQSLGEIARKNQQKRAAHASTAPPPKVITNSDLPQNSSTSLANAAASRRAASQRTAEQRAAVQWRQQILVQENKVANLQARFDRLRAQIHLVNPNANYSSGEGIAYNPGQARQIVRLQEMQDQLNQQKQKLDQMQEAARHAGMHTTVYDP